MTKLDGNYKGLRVVFPQFNQQFNPPPSPVSSLHGRCWVGCAAIVPVSGGGENMLTVHSRSDLQHLLLTLLLIGVPEGLFVGALYIESSLLPNIHRGSHIATLLSPAVLAVEVYLFLQRQGIIIVQIPTVCPSVVLLILTFCTDPGHKLYATR